MDFPSLIVQSPELSHESKQMNSPFPESERSIILKETRTTRSRWREVLHNPQFQEEVWPELC